MSEKKLQYQGTDAIYAENETVHDKINSKHRNKNLEPIVKQKVTFDKNIREFDSEEVDVIKITREDNDLSSALMDIEVILRCFNGVPILFNFGDFYIHLEHDKLLYANVLSSVYAKTVPLNRLVDLCNIYQTFVAVGSDGDRVRILLKTSMTYHLFGKLGIVKKSLRSKMSVKCKDLLPIYYRSKRQQSKNVTGYSTANQRKHERINYETISIRLKLHFKKALCPRITRRLRIVRQFPVEDELFHFPVQATSGDLDNQLDQQVPSEVTPSLFYVTNQSLFASSAYVASNNAPNTPRNFHTHNSSTPNTNVQTQNLPSHFYINDSSLGALNRPTVPPRHERYVNNIERIASFERWPHQMPTSTQLSEAGFFFTNDGDLVRCFQCGIGLKDFSQDDDPLLEHVRHSGKCPFLPQLLGEERLASIKRHLRQTDPEYYRQMQLNGELNPDELSSYRHPEYRTMEARLSTFTNWPRHIIQTPQRLAEAGLYYIGIDDHVRCFACDGGLRRWDPEDDPWTEHCRWFPACPFAIEQKGEQFIALVQASVENERLGASGGGGGIDDMASAMERLRIRESETENVIKQHNTAICRDMGFEEMELKDAVLELNDRGNKTPSVEDIVDVIEIIRDRKADANIESSVKDESPLEENRRLKNHVFCMKCETNNTNALFLPCTHHRFCMSCAEPLQKCPVCRRNIKEKIRTYMV